MAGIDDQEEPIDSGDEEISAITDNFSSQNNNENSSRLPTSTSRSPSPRPDSPNFSGKWRLSTSENFDPFMRDCNVNYFKRQAAKIISSEHHITQEGDSMSVDVVATGGGKHQEYEIGGSFREQEMNGEEAEVETAWDGDRIRERHRTNSLDYTMTRELEDEVTMVLRLESPQGTKAKRIYKKIE